MGQGRYVIHGAGAIGAAIGARLFEAGHDVVLIARGAHLAALQAAGLTYGDPERTRVLPIPAVGRPSEVDWRHGDVVLLAVKGQDTEAALGDLAASAPTDLPIVCAQNGVENERRALRRFADVYGMCVMMPATHLEPGAVDADSLPVVGVLDVGRYPRGIDDRAEQVAGDLSESGFSSRPDPDVMRWKYDKMLLNLSTGLRAACGLAEDDGPEDAALRKDLEQRLRDEALACYVAAGVVLPTAAESKARLEGQLSSRPIPGRPRGAGSGWQSMARGTGTVEVDFVNGEVAMLGRLHGVATPVNAHLQRVANDLARRGAAPGSCTLADFAAGVGVVAPVNGSDAVEPFLLAARFAGDVVARPEVGRRWTGSSALPLADVGTVAGHLFLVLRRVDKHLDDPGPAGEVPRPWAYHAPKVEQPGDLELPVHRQVRLDGAHVAAWGWEAVVLAFAERLAKVEGRLQVEVPDAIHLGGGLVPFGGYLASRVTELLVHADDLAASTGLTLDEPPAAAMDVALDFVLGLARAAHGDVDVLRSFTRRERVGPTLPAVY